MELLLGVIVGAVIVWVAPGLTGKVLRPAAKGVIKGSVVAYKAASEAASEAYESMGDVVSEAKSEMTDRPKADATPATRRRRK
jgi:hypothetical protein